MKLTCPHCHEQIAVRMKVEPVARERMAGTMVGAPPEGYRSFPGVERAVAAFVRTLEPGRHQNAELRTRYEAWRRGHGAAPLSPQGLSIAMRAIGVPAYRDTMGRGFDVPEPVTPTVLPSAPSPEARLYHPLEVTPGSEFAPTGAVPKYVFGPTIAETPSDGAVIGITGHAWLCPHFYVGQSSAAPCTCGRVPADAANAAPEASANAAGQEEVPHG